MPAALCMVRAFVQNRYLKEEDGWRPPINRNASEAAKNIFTMD